MMTKAHKTSFNTKHSPIRGLGRSLDQFRLNDSPATTSNVYRSQQASNSGCVVGSLSQNDGWQSTSTVITSTDS